MRTDDVSGRELAGDSSSSKIVEFPPPEPRAAKENDVRRINPYEFYEIGNAVNTLKQMKGREVTLGDAYIPLNGLQQKLDALLRGDIMEVTFSRYDAATLATQIGRVVRSHYYDDKGEFDLAKDWGQKLHSWELVSIFSALDKFEHTLSAELREAATYYIPRIGIFDTPRLVDNAEQHIDAELRPLMNDMAVKDFHDAGRCLAFDLPTASGFHAARSVEGVLASYYKTFAGEAAPPPNNGTMGDYLKALEEMTQSIAGNLPEQKTLRTLREIAKLDRNPVMHPRESLDQQEAAIFFNLATSAIMAMTREMKALSSAGQQKLPLASTVLLGGMMGHD